MLEFRYQVATLISLYFRAPIHHKTFRGSVRPSLSVLPVDSWIHSIRFGWFFSKIFVWMTTIGIPIYKTWNFQPGQVIVPFPRSLPIFLPSLCCYEFLFSSTTFFLALPPHSFPFANEWFFCFGSRVCFRFVRAFIWFLGFHCVFPVVHVLVDWTSHAAPPIRSEVVTRQSRRYRISRSSGVGDLSERPQFPLVVWLPVCLPTLYAAETATLGLVNFASSPLRAVMKVIRDACVQSLKFSWPMRRKRLLV